MTRDVDWHQNKCCTRKIVLSYTRWKFSRRSKSRTQIFRPLFTREARLKVTGNYFFPSADIILVWQPWIIKKISRQTLSNDFFTLNFYSGTLICKRFHVKTISYLATLISLFFFAKLLYFWSKRKDDQAINSNVNITNAYHWLTNIKYKDAL